MKTTIEAYNKLESIAKNKKYKVFGTPIHGNYVNHSSKTIVMNALITDENNIKMSHEIGHIYNFKIWKWLIILDELTAWIIGLYICKRNGISTNNFKSIAWKCLKTYIKTGKENK